MARAFNRSGATRAVAFDISKVFDRVWHAGLLHKLKFYGISGKIFGLISSFLSNRQLQLVLDGKSSQEYPVNSGAFQGSILHPTLFNNWLPNLNLIYEKLWTEAGSGLLISMLEKVNWFHLTVLIILVLLM